MKTYTAAVIGAGSGGRLSMVGLAASDRFDLVAAADPRPEARAAAESSHPGLRTFPSHADLFSACPTDVVCVSTWPPSHLEVTRAALQLPLAGILVEKPLADTAADGAAILAAIRKRHLPVAVPHGLLVAAHVREIIERVRGGEVGDLKLVEIECAGWDIINAGIHWMNFCVALLGGDPVVTVLAACDVSTRTYRDDMQVETEAMTLAQTRGGVRLVMHTGDYVPISVEGKGVVFRLVGSAGTLTFYAWESAYHLLSSDHPSGHLHQVDPAPGTAHQRHLEALAAHMDAGTADYTVAEGSLAALEICEAAYLSSRRRCTVSLPLTGFSPPPLTDWDPGRPYRGDGGGRDGRHLPPAGP